MALEYTFYGAADATSEELRSLIAAAVGGSVTPDGTILREGMHVTAARVGSDDAHSTTRLFGFDHRVTAIFRFANLSTTGISEHNSVLMVAAVLAVFDTYPALGVLLFNGEEAVLQRFEDGVVFNCDWEDWSEVDEMAPLLAGHQVRPLPQPLL